jgi:hypothetical protein
MKERGKRGERKEKRKGKTTEEENFECKLCARYFYCTNYL